MKSITKFVIFSNNFLLNTNFFSASPILGILIDKTGRNILYVTIAIAITLVCHALLTFTFINPYFAIAIMGLAYSLLASALWPIAALIIPEYQLGTAYGK